jgi:Zn ribbon nucleic-acid-binding protein
MPTLTDEEIVRRIRIVRHTPQEERLAHRAPSLQSIAQAAGIARKRLYEIAKTGHMSPRDRVKLEAILATWAESMVHETVCPRCGHRHPARPAERTI